MFIEPAERESRRAPRGKPARPCFWTHGKITPRCSILGGPIGIQFCIQILFVFFVLVTQGGCRFASFRFHFCSILEAFGLHFASFWSLLASIGRPWRGPWRRDVFSLIFEAKMVAKWSPRGSQNPFKMGSKFHCFFDPFLEAFWMPKWTQNQSPKR